VALEKIVQVDKVELVGDYSIQVRTATKVMDDGKQIGSTSYHRHVVHPSSNWTNEDAKVKKIADALFDADCKEAYFVSQNGYPSGEPSDAKWTEAQLKKYLSVNGVAWTEEHTKAQLLTKAKDKFGE
tara:strand:- start:27 stop:407 length:381 start_codon:yes stop_codon:yes gene_type:complete